MVLSFMNLIKRFKGNKTLLNGSLFSIYSFFNEGIAFLLLLLLANYIAPKEYGQLSLFNTVVQFMSYFVALSTQGFLSVSFFRRGEEHFRQDFSSICLICLFGTITFSIINLLGGSMFAQKLSIPNTFLWLAISISFFSVFQRLWLNFHRIKEEVGIYGIISCSAAILNLILSLYLVIGAGYNWKGRVYAQVLCTAVYGIIAFFYFANKKLFTRNVTWPNIKMVAFWGIPLIPHLASVWIKQGGDRFIINHFHSVEDVGLFSFALNLTSVIIIIGSAFNSSNSVSLYKILSSSLNALQKRQQLKRQTRNIALILFVAYVFVVLSASILVPILLPRYSSSIPYFLILSLQGLGQCFYFLFCNYLFYFSRNKQIMYTTFFTSLFHLGLSFILTHYSLYYTCVIYVVSQVLVTGTIFLLSNRILKLNLIDDTKPLN